MYEKEELKIKQQIYEILTKDNDKFIITENIMLLIKDNINILFDMNKHVDK